MRVPVLVLATLLAIPPAVLAEDRGDWPQFHGPRRDNISRETGLLKQWPPDGPRLLWTAKGLGHGYATVSISRGLIYTCGNVNDKTVITALDLDGKTRWRFDNGGAWIGSQPGARGTPTIDGDYLYHENPLGDVVCLEARSGKRSWGLNILERFNSKNITWALAESVLIDGDRVICSPGGPEAAMVALDKRTGQTVWKSPSAAGDLAGYASPSLGEYQGLRMLFTLTSKAAIGVNADNGDLLWRFEHVTPFEEMITMPLYHDGHVLASTRTAGTVLLKLEVDGKRASVREVWRATKLDNQHGGLILLDGFIYGSCHVNNNGRWMCLDFNSGAAQYNEVGVGKGSLTYADGMLYVMNESGTVGLVKAIPSAHEVVSQFKLPGGGEGPTWAHPVVCGGRLYIRHSDLLYAYDVRANR
jgi:hypothetical protein